MQHLHVYQFSYNTGSEEMVDTTTQQSPLSGVDDWANACLLPNGTMRCFYEISGEFDVVLWTASLILLRSLEVDGHRSSWVGTRVLELGAGTGHLAVGLARLGAHVVATAPRACRR